MTCVTLGHFFVEMIDHIAHMKTFDLLSRNKTIHVFVIFLLMENKYLYVSVDVIHSHFFVQKFDHTIDMHMGVLRCGFVDDFLMYPMQ